MYNGSYFIKIVLKFYEANARLKQKIKCVYFSDEFLSLNLFSPIGEGRRFMRLSNDF